MKDSTIRLKEHVRWFPHINHSELLEYNNVLLLCGGLQDEVSVINDRLCHCVKPVRFYSSAMYV